MTGARSPGLPLLYMYMRGERGEGHCFVINGCASSMSREFCSGQPEVRQWCIKREGLDVGILREELAGSVERDGVTVLRRRYSG